jgi:hypothetical protein
LKEGQVRIEVGRAAGTTILLQFGEMFDSVRPRHEFWNASCAGADLRHGCAHVRHIEILDVKACLKTSHLVGSIELHIQPAHAEPNFKSMTDTSGSSFAGIAEYIASWSFLISDGI